MGIQSLKRREFLRMAGAGFAAYAVPAGVRGYEPLPALKIRRVSLPVGASRPFRVLHVSDSHVARIDSSDTDAMYAFARTRSRIGRELGEYYLGEAAHNARSAGMKIVHTGDFMDFASEANLEYASRWLGTYDCLACVGNHEYWNSPEKREVEECKVPQVAYSGDDWCGDVSKSVSVTFTPPENSGILPTTLQFTGTGATTFTFTEPGRWTVSLTMADGTTRTATLFVYRAMFVISFT